MPPNGYLNTFGGQNINPADLSFVAYTIDADLTLVWPFEAVEGSTIAAAKLNVAATTTGLSVSLPAADLVTVGQDILIHNTSSNTFTVKDYGGAALGAVASGQSWFFYLTDNSFVEGLWDVVQFGTGTSSATAASLAGAGLVANVTVLDQNLETDVETTSISIDSTSRARVIQNEGGTVVWTIDDAAITGNGFFFYAINAGTGTVTLTPTASTIDGDSTKILQPLENCIVFSDGANYHTLGYGRVLISEVTGVSVNVAGSGDYVLSDTERDAQVQDFTGTLTGAKTITYGNAVGYWFVYNNTSGAYTLTARVDSLDPGAVLTQGFFTVIRSNGTNMEIAFTDAGGTITSISQVAGETVATPNPIVTTGTIGLANTAVAPGTYGTAARTVTVTVDQKGRATAASDQLISIPISQVQVMTSAELAGRVSDETGSGALVFGTSPTIVTPTITNPTVTTGTFTSPTMVTPTLGVATATTLNGLTIVPTTGTLDVANAKTLNVDNTLNMTGADGSNVNFVGGGSVMYGQAGQSNFLGADVLLLVDGTVYNGPQLTLGSGSFFVSGTLLYRDPNAGARTVFWKLWDGTTVFASGSAGNTGGTNLGSGNAIGYAIPYCGVVTNPAAAVVIAVWNEAASGAVASYLAYNFSGQQKDCSMFAFRIGY